MAQQEGSSTVVQVQQALLDDRDFLNQVVGQILQELQDQEFTDFLGAERYERSGRRRGHRNGSYSRTVYTHVGAIELQVPRDRNGEFSTTLFARYNRAEKALLLSL